MGIVPCRCHDSPARLARSPCSRSSFDQLPSAPQDTATQQAPTTSVTSSSSDGLKTWHVLLLAAGGVILIGGIGWAIARDARGYARSAGLKIDPENDRPRPDSHAARKAAKQHRRRQRKTARSQRRRNR